MSQYQDRVNAIRLARQAPVVQRTAEEIFEALKRIDQYLYWSINPEEEDPSYYVANLIEHAHNLVDLGHDWRAVLKDNPPPKENEEEPDSAA